MTNKRNYDFDFIETTLRSCEYDCYIDSYGIRIVPTGEDSLYKPDIVCYTDDDRYDIDNDNFYIIRFAIVFAGLGSSSSSEREDMIYNNIVSAKKVVDTLNEYIDNCNNEIAV